MPAEINIAEAPVDFDALEQDFQQYSKKAVSTVDMCTPEKESQVGHTMDFLVGTTRNPAYTYDKQSTVTEDSVEAYRAEGQDILVRHSIPDKFKNAYEKSIGRLIKRGELGLALRQYNEDKTPENKANVMALNIELYGKPDEATYHSLLQEKISRLATKDKSPSAERIFNELKENLPEGLDGPPKERFRPSKETIEWVQQVIDALYGNMLRRVPETDEMITAAGLRDIFETIIRKEFEGAADDWSVELGDVKYTYVDVRKKKIFIPENRASLTSLEAKKLVVHEIGIHMLRAVMGGETNVGPLETGLEGALDDDEGLGKVMEQALAGEFTEAGVNHYITAGLAYFDNEDFRDSFEIKWRMKLLEDLEPGEEPTPEQVQKARQLAIDGPEISTLRTYRGTNELPLFMNLSYYNGSVNIWKYFETIRGDDLQLSLLLAGNVSTSKEHQRVVLESSSRG